ncbi:type II toxin-antitoxin system HicB family antitoxin [Ruminococcaceae bacterium OttesenSCG-928-A16]|nr:type II toxin-antitoxin system HicB family antitoxin [Ruminococcaceae bacterium OttesenSCG-928-A16]
MIKVYPTVLTPTTIGSKPGYAVFVPDLEINTQGYDLADAIAMARDAIGIKGICEQDEGRAIPEPSTAEPSHTAGDIVTWVDIDFDKYRRANDMRTVRVNVTVPQYLKDLGEEQGVNFSQTLQKALKEELKIAE